MLIIPLKSVPTQSLSVVLSNQVCQINLRTTAFGLYMDLYVSNALIVAGVLCQNLNLIVRDPYLGFIGDFIFIDNQGVSDPDYTGLGLAGSRFSLAYLSPTDLATI